MKREPTSLLSLKSDRKGKWSLMRSSHAVAIF